MNKQQQQRYSRQIQLPDIGIEGQKKINHSRVLIIGLGGLGSPVALYLAAAGVGHLRLVDFDSVDLSNLQRQVIHDTNDLGKHKAQSAVESIQRINPDIQADALNYTLDDEALMTEVESADVVVDCCDNFTTRFELNKACVKTATPLVSGAVVRMEGQVSVFDSRIENSPCYQCLYKPGGEEGEVCAQVGILAPVAGIVGSLQATETLKLILGLPTLVGKLLLIDAKTAEFRTIHLPKDTACRVCTQ